MTVPVDPIAVALSVTRVLDRLAVLHAIGGSIASSLAGEPRSSVDVDIIRKTSCCRSLRWYRKGGEASDRQWRDILGIIRVQAPRLDRDYLRRHAPALGVEDLLAPALQDASS